MGSFFKPPADVGSKIADVRRPPWTSNQGGRGGGIKNVRGAADSLYDGRPIEKGSGRREAERASPTVFRENLLEETVKKDYLVLFSRARNNLSRPIEVG